MRKESDRHPLRMVVLISQLGITMMVSLFFCAWIGYFLADKTGNVLCFLVFLILGILAGFRSCYNIISKFVDLGNQEEDKETKDRKNRDTDEMDI